MSAAREEAQPDMAHTGRAQALALHKRELANDPTRLLHLAPLHSIVGRANPQPRSHIRSRPDTQPPINIKPLDRIRRTHGCTTAEMFAVGRRKC
eukprot:2260226-Pyramimonas_sp.AAC.1